jgi:NADPH:quinone reductase-like Zn-dependent oxidoreductase
VQLSLPLILGSDLAGFVDSVGAGVVQFKPGDEVFGVLKGSTLIIRSKPALEKIVNS